MIFIKRNVWFISLAIIGKLFCHHCVTGEALFNTTEFQSENCDHVRIENAVLNVFEHRAEVSCVRGYDLEGPKDVKCFNGQWSPTPRCIPMCIAPLNLENGILTLNEVEDSEGNYHKGTLATYSCNKGYTLSPPESKFRVCEEGVWTGPTAKCFKIHQNPTECNRPPEILNGYFVSERNDQLNPFGVGQRLHYSCKEGYILKGSPVQLCLESGNWSPKIQPTCWKPQIVMRSSKRRESSSCGWLSYILWQNIKKYNF
ncbi:hypothetical protein HHI36_010709 [Cryptolaemus montrouzieri]|uniref:Sushi domain-containing protein n=1 Tax=Cryptolaemus montrouzieri TaxID=559131 RepID=A0ABD2MJG4_9CUCU